jgi:hypothetical protein
MVWILYPPKVVPPRISRGITAAPEREQSAPDEVPKYQNAFPNQATPSAVISSEVSTVAARRPGLVRLRVGTGDVR